MDDIQREGSKKALWRRCHFKWALEKEGGEGGGWLGKEGQSNVMDHMVYKVKKQGHGS